MLQLFGTHSTLITTIRESAMQGSYRWVLNDFIQYSSVSAMIGHLSWPIASLELRRRLQTLYNIINEHYSLAIPPCTYYPNGKIHQALFHSILDLLMLYTASTEGLQQHVLQP